MMTKKQIAANEVARRRGNFERHVADCEDCEAMSDGAAYVTTLCMSGLIMFRHYFNAVIATREVKP